MSFFDYIKNKLFSNKEISNKRSSNPYVHEMLKRSETEKEKFKEWKESIEKNSILNFIYNQYKLSKTGDEDQSMVRILNAKPSFGFMIRYPGNIDALEFQHLLDYFKEKLQETGYRVYASDKKMYDKKDFVETIERHHLKARKDIKSYGIKPVDQLYGNITAELYKINDEPSYIKFLCNVYSDSAFNPAKDFDELIELLTEN